MKKQKPFLIDLTLPTSEMLGKHLLGNLETTKAWVVPIYENTPPSLVECLDAAREAICDAIYCEDGLNGSTGDTVIKWITDCLGDAEEFYKTHSASRGE